jgi:hypothetical protein
MSEESVHAELRSWIEWELRAQLALRKVDLDLEEIRGLADHVAYTVSIAFEVIPKAVAEPPP